MHGAGNDFILIDSRKNELLVTAALVAAMCQRRTGIGADGLILLSDSNEFDFRMDYFNADGSVGEMCGNGARCAVAFAQRLAYIEEQGHFEVDGKAYFGQVTSADRVRLRMNSASLLAEAAHLPQERGRENMLWLDTGVPHLIIPHHGSLEGVEVVEEGRSWRHHAAFEPRGTNVNFIEAAGDGELNCRVYERGVENETLACGTGAVACGLYAQKIWGWSSPIQVNNPGGSLIIEFDNEWTDIYLTGPVATVYDGEFAFSNAP